MAHLSILVPFLLALCYFHTVASTPAVNEKALAKQQHRLKSEARVEQINKGQKKWKAKVHPRFAEMSDAEFKQLLGLRLDHVEHAKAMSERGFERTVVARKAKKLAAKKNMKFGKKTTTTTTTEAPEPENESFDARVEWPECADVIDKIQDQSYCGSCWAVSSASVMQDRICIRSDGEQKVDISAADVMSCVMKSYGCYGGWPEQAFQFWNEHGVCTGSNYTLWQGCKPYPVPPDADSMFETPKCTRHCKNRKYGKKYQKDQHYGHSVVNLQYAEEEEIMNAIKQGGPVEANMIVYDDFRFYESGVYTHNQYSYAVGGHAVRIIGWGYCEESELPYWLVANSWGAEWGLDGYFKIARGEDESYIESWGINYAEPTLD